MMYTLRRRGNGCSEAGGAPLRRPDRATGLMENVQDSAQDGPATALRPVQVDEVRRGGDRQRLDAVGAVQVIGEHPRPEVAPIPQLFFAKSKAGVAAATGGRTRGGGSEGALAPAAARSAGASTRARGRRRRRPGRPARPIRGRRPSAPWDGEVAPPARDRPPAPRDEPPVAGGRLDGPETPSAAGVPRGDGAARRAGAGRGCPAASDPVWRSACRGATRAPPVPPPPAGTGRRRGAARTTAR
jgi:hypothetical protein